VYDDLLQVPACSVAEPWCDSGVLLDGRGPLGPEANQPNTLGGGCADGTSGTYHASPSVDSIRVRTADGSVLTNGQTALVEMTVWASSSYWRDRVELFTCPDPSAAKPVWSYLATLRPSREGAQVLFAEVPVTMGAQAIRAHMLYDDVIPIDSVACGITDNPAVLDDHDDLVFTAAP
jgi:leucyl aminopeptidase